MTPENLFVAGLAAYIPPVLSATEAVAHGWYDPESCQLEGWTGAAVAGDIPPAEIGRASCRERV